ncbi:MAG: hypothetical protein B6I24_05315 [Bacteroidetes bacterium 4572_128]|nr:MAG: hypothetical protein B6I24_05315 [Bacteroidetes bacterium 4572_128]
MKKFFLLIFLISFNIFLGISQEDTIKINYSNFTKDEILDMDYNDMMDLDLEILIMLSKKMEMSLSEFQEMLLNPSQYISSKKKEKSFTSPLSISVISSKEIEESGAISIPEVLRLVPGIIVREKINGDYDVHIRGLDNIPHEQPVEYSINTKTLVMIDERVVYNYFQGGTIWNALPIGLNDIDKIEIIRGPSSALYGSNAMTGVINIITKKVESKKLKINANFQYGNVNTKILNLSALKKINKKLGFRLSGNFHEEERFQKDYFCHATKSEIPLDSFIYYMIPNNVFGTDSFSDYYNRIKTILDNRFSDVNLAKKQRGINAFLYYNWSKNIKLDLSFGTENSKWQSVYIENDLTSYSFNESSTKYINFKLYIKGIRFKISNTRGYYDNAKNVDGYKYDINILSYDLDYNFNIGNLNFYSELNYKSAFYSDKNYSITETKNGFLNGEHNLKTFALSLKADYKLLDDKLRFIIGVRKEYYNEIKGKITPALQFASSYKINENNFIRFSVSTANKSPFMVDTHTNYYIKGKLEIEEGFVVPAEISLDGNKNLDLLKTINYEIGFRNKLHSNIYFDIEFFTSKTENFAISVIDSAYFNLDKMVFIGKKKYKNVQIKAKQFGITGNLNIVLNKKINLKMFSSFQSTFLTDLNKFILVDTVFNIYVDKVKEELITMKSKSTPSFYGGFFVNYYPIKKLYFNFNYYFYGEQNFDFKDNEESFFFSYKTKKKFIFNFKINYKFYKNNSVFFNAKNLFNDKSKEFAFADKNGATYLIGLNLNF